MANNKTALKAELLALLTATSNIDGPSKVKLRDRFAAEYENAYARFLGQEADSPAKRGQFLADFTVEIWANVFRVQSRREKVANLPNPDQF